MKKQQKNNNNNNNKQSETKQYFYCIFKLENNCLKSVSIVKSKNFQHNISEEYFLKTTTRKQTNPIQRVRWSWLTLCSIRSFLTRRMMSFIGSHSGSHWVSQ